jgi:hypothetical protein
MRGTQNVRLPNFLIIGAEKCGTTSLYYYLKQHPEVYLPKRKELHYFSCEHMKKQMAGPGDKRILPALCATRQEYNAYYQHVRSERAVGDASPSYFYFAEVSERIQAELGKPKMVLALRDPIDKAYSQYMHLVRDNRETLEFYDALMAEKQRTKEGWSAFWRYAESSLYAEKIKRYLHVFGEDHIRIILFEDLASVPHLVMHDLFQFLGVDADFRPHTDTVHNKSGKPKSKILADFIAKPNVVTIVAKKIIPESVRTAVRVALLNINTGSKGKIDSQSQAYLREYFYHDVCEVEKILGRKLTWLNGERGI